MNSIPGSSSVLILLSFLVAMVLQVVPLAAVMQPLRPCLVYMVLFYWAMYLPVNAVLVIAFFAGLLLDSLQGNMLGLNSFVMLLIVFMVSIVSRQARMFSIWQQSLFLGFVLLLVNLIHLLLLNFRLSFQEWLISTFLSVLLWPVVVTALGMFDRHRKNFYHL